MVTIHSKRGNLATDDMQILPRFKGTRTYALGFDRKIKELVTPIGGLDKPVMELERA